MKTALLKDTFKEITHNYKRFISMLLIVLLGVGFFAGIKAASPDMKETLDQYFDTQNVMDIQVISTLGLTTTDLEELQKVEGVEQIEGSYSTDAIVNSGEEEFVVKLESLPTNMNQLTLVEGRLPENNTECVVEENFLLGTKHHIGDQIEIEVEDITNDDGETQKLLKEEKVTIVGTVQSPLYIYIERGSTKLGSGKIDYYMYIPRDNFDTDLSTVAYITVEGAKELKTYQNSYEDRVQEVKDKIDAISEERRQARYDEIYNEANSKIEDAQKELDEQTKKAQDEIEKAEKELEDGKAEIEEGKAKLQSEKNSTYSELEDAKEQLDKAKKQLQEKQELFEEEKVKAEKQIEEAQNNLELLQEAQKQYNTASSTLTENQTKIAQLQEQLQGLDETDDAEEIKNIKTQIANLQKQNYILQATMQTIEEQLKKQGIEIENLESTIRTIQTEISSAKKQLEESEELLNKANSEIKEQTKKYEQGKKTADTEFANAQKELEDAQKEIEDGEKELEKAKKEAEEQIAEAEEKLEKARLDLEEIEKPDWYILDREANTGYVSYLQDTDRVANIAQVFPVVFFLVAALISLTSMTRMVEEQRVQIGTLKGLGYSKFQIASKYIIYALIATILGSLIGMAIGFYLLPSIIFDMYCMMYTLPPIVLEFNTEYATLGLLAAMVCTVGATIYSCARTLASTPASLMRPKAPKPGKRVFLEKIPFIWSKLNFTQKVTLRNIFRYKKRFLMTIIGIAGCTSLIIAGFGLRDAIGSMIPSQYGEIFRYNLEISLREGLTTKQTQEAYETISAKENIANSMLINMQSVSIDKNDNNQSIQLVVPQDVEKLKDFITLRDRKHQDETYQLDNSGVIITEKLATLLDIKQGDTIILELGEDNKVEVKVTAITENYLFHYIYMSPELYKQLYEEEIKSNTILAIIPELTLEGEDELGKEILGEEDYISGVTFTSVTTDMFEDVMNNMSLVVFILIVAAGMLAFLVLYSLSNTNISERIRELATIKVLGFYHKEVYNYVGKETIILTIIGILLGLGGGYFLTTYIIKTCELDMLMFNPQIRFMSYIYGILITAIFTIIVSIGTYFALKKIDMIESLKSVE